MGTGEGLGIGAFSSGSVAVGLLRRQQWWKWWVGRRLVSVEKLSREREDAGSVG